MRYDEPATSHFVRVIRSNDDLPQRFCPLVTVFNIVTSALIAYAISLCELVPRWQARPPSDQVDIMYLTRNCLVLGVTLRSQTTYTVVRQLQV